ncbi:hypothetical protein [Cellulomonas gelida]|uniref:hypothetical protein n=1 Tax=Cellulomonas gelida TaxID=1712 RepID=UPI0011447B20|nr:hypothetical protein [Cellulomonas gelida]
MSAATESERPFAPVPGAEHDDDEDDEVESRPRHPYTWLHLIVLALVAFVLGFLLVLLYTKANDGASAASSALSIVTTAPRAGPSA